MKSSPMVLSILGSLWILAIVFGLSSLMKYESLPGQQACPPEQYPKHAQIRLATDSATLIMFAHPQCPCTRASIAELAQLMSKHGSNIKAYVLFLNPRSTPKEWKKTDLWHSAEAIPGVMVLPDNEGMEARRFNSATSGQTMVYDAKGRLLFTGGITAARGHIGDNLGLDSLAQALNKKPLNKKPLNPKTSLVFGCSLVSPHKQ